MLDLQFAATHARGFILVQLSPPHGTILELYLGYSLPFAPTSPPVVAAEARDFANRGADGNGFNIGDSTEQAEMHALRVLALQRKVKPPSNESRIRCVVRRPPSGWTRSLAVTCSSVW